MFWIMQIWWIFNDIENVTQLLRAYKARILILLQFVQDVGIIMGLAEKIEIRMWSQYQQQN